MRESIYNLRWIILISLVTLLTFVFIFALIKSGKKNNVDANIDEYSGEIISDPKNKSPENSNESIKTATFYGSSELLKSGLTLDQFDAIKGSINTYLYTSDIPANSVSIKTNSIDFDNTNESYNLIKFPIKINQSKDHLVYVYQYGIQNISVSIYSDNKRVYDSGRIILRK